MRRFAHGRLGVAWLLAGACGSRGTTGPGDGSPDVGPSDAAADSVPWPDVPSGMVFVSENRCPARAPLVGFGIYFPVSPGPVRNQDLPADGTVDGCAVYPYWKRECPELCDPIPPRNAVCRDGECIGLRSAGRITLGGTVLGTIGFEPDAEAQYFGDLDDPRHPQLFNLGDSLQVTAEGAAHPGFSASITGPGEVAETDPPLFTMEPDGGWPRVSRSEGFTVSWTPVLPDQRIQVGVYGGPSVVLCDLADEGSFAVTPAIIEAAGASVAGDVISVLVQRANETRAPTPEGYVWVVAATWAGGVLELAP